MTRTRIRRATTGVAVAVLLAVGVGPAAADTPAAGRVGWSCTTRTIPTPTGQTAPWQVTATICTPRRWAAHRPRTVHVFTHGATLTRAYWDWPGLTRTPVDLVLAAGAATATYDLVGSGGQSTLPPFDQVTLTTSAQVLDAVARAAMRATHTHRWVSWGHSLGSGIVVTHAGTPGMFQPAAVVLTGFQFGPKNPAIAMHNHPAMDDPAFTGRPELVGYATTRPGPEHRAAIFDAPGTVNPAVLAQDEAWKGVVSGAVFGQFLGLRGLPAGVGNPAAGITAPVVLVNGDLDQIACVPVGCSDNTDMVTRQRLFFAAAESVTAVHVPGMGHNLAQAGSGDAGVAAVLQWVVSGHKGGRSA